MDTSPQPIDSYVSLWEADLSSKIVPVAWLKRLQPWTERFKWVVEASTQQNHHVTLRLQQAAALASSFKPKAVAAWEAAHPIVVSHGRKVAPFLPWPELNAEASEPDAVQSILADFAGLDQERQGRVAKNIVLLWDNFQEMFGGISGFLAAAQTDQDAFMEKLAAASARMQAARGSEAAFHYVTVELMRQYISFFQSRRSDPGALALARCVVSLINRGRQMEPAPLVYSLTS